MVISDSFSQGDGSGIAVVNRRQRFNGGQRRVAAQLLNSWHFSVSFLKERSPHGAAQATYGDLMSPTPCASGGRVRSVVHPRRKHRWAFVQGLRGSFRRDRRGRCFGDFRLRCRRLSRLEQCDPLAAPVLAAPASGIAGTRHSHAAGCGSESLPRRGRTCRLVVGSWERRARAALADDSHRAGDEWFHGEDSVAREC